MPVDLEGIDTINKALIITIFLSLAKAFRALGYEWFQTPNGFRRAPPPFVFDQGWIMLSFD